jgi:hypothetical protein
MGTVAADLCCRRLRNPTETTTRTTGGGTALDKNGIEYVQPLLSDGFRLIYSSETWTFNKNFRTDGSMRCDFEDLVRNSAFLAGYFKVTGSDMSEEVSAKMNGGPHSHRMATYADTMDLGIVNFAGTKSRIRWEKTHPNYSSSISPTSHQLPIGDIRNKWMGFAGLKVNLDTDDDGKPDKVAILGMVDVGGLTAEETKPANQWKVTFKHIFTPSEIELKSIFTPYVATIGKPELAEHTIRIDQQSHSAWTSSNPPYKFVTCKEVNATRV